MLIKGLILMSVLSVAFCAELYYCVQLASSKNVEDLKRLIKFSSTLPDLRIEKIGEMYTLRAGFFVEKRTAERVLRKSRDVFPDAFVRKCRFEPERIVVPSYERKRKRFYTYEVGMKLANLYIKKKELDKAEEVYRELANMYPDSREVKLQLARVLYWRGKYDEALEIYKDLERFDPKLADERRKVEIRKIMEQVKVLEEKGELDKAVELLEKLYKEEKESYEIGLKLGKLYLRMGRYKQARRVLADLMRRYPGDKDIRALYARSTSTAGKKNRVCT